MEVFSNANKQDFLTSQQAAKILGVSLRTVQLWVENGSLSAWKTAGGHRRITYASVNQLLDKRTSDLSKNPGEKHGSNRLKVLVVEDEQVQLMMYRLKFDQWDLPIHLETVRNGFDALMKVNANKPDVLITDLNLPGMDGIQMVNRLESLIDIHDMKIIAVTSLTSEDIERRGGLPDSVSLFYKPIPFHLLETLLRDIVVKGTQPHL